MKVVIMSSVLTVLIVVSGLFPQRVFAHDGLPPAPHDVWSAWNWEPTFILSLGVGMWVYARGLSVLRRRVKWPQSAFRWRAASFLTGVFVLFLALISPLDALGSALFSAHMLQHMVLILIAPPLLILGAPLGPFLLGLSSSVRITLGHELQRITWYRAVWRAVSQPIVAWSLHTLALWLWHLPFLYEATLQNEMIHLLEHFSFLGTALLFWWTILPLHKRMNLGVWGGILALFTMAVQGGLLGALITFSPTLWYSAYITSTQPWGLTPLEDQQLAGAIMWIPAGTGYTLIALILFMQRLTLMERTAQQRLRKDR